MRIALCQINPVVGDLQGNADQIVAAVEAAAAAGADLAVTPEQSIAGYPAEDLLLRIGFLTDCRSALTDLAARLLIPTLVGWPEYDVDAADGPEGAVGAWEEGPHRAGMMFNSASLLMSGKVAATCRKELLPNYGVFDEARYFADGRGGTVVQLAGTTVGITVCEDLWHEAGPHRACAAAGAEVIVNLSASPYRLGRVGERHDVVRARARETGRPVLLCNLVGGHDDLVFDGASIAASPDGTSVPAPGFAAGVQLVDVDPASGTVGDAGWLPMDAQTPPTGPGPRGHGTAPELWAALCTGLGDYVRKNRIARVWVGLSGGIDSAVVAAIACDALGPAAVTGVTMPSQYSSTETRADARELGNRLGITVHELPIESSFAALSSALEPALGGEVTGLAAENLQARVRGVLLMACANQHGGMVLATGNKSEVSVGYMTLYGDMAGGFAPLKDVVKTRVWELARWRNEVAEDAGGRAPIPASTIERPPTAELRAGQRDSDSLPPYDILDPLLEQYVEADLTVQDLIERGAEPELAARVAALVDGAEHKRRQAPPGPRVSAKAFGRERRHPITNGYR